MKKRHQISAAIVLPSTLLLAGAPSLQGQDVSDTFWTGAVDLDWNTSGNWDPSGVPGDGALAEISNGDAVSTSANGSIMLGQLLVAGGSTLDLSHELGQSGPAENELVGIIVGGGTGTGIINVLDGGFLSTAGDGQFRVGSADTSGTLTLADGGELEIFNADGIAVGRDNASMGVFTMSGGTLNHYSGDFKVGSFGGPAGGSGVWNMEGGMATIRSLRVGFAGQESPDSVATINQTGGEVSHEGADPAVGWAAGGTCTYNISGGTFTSTSRIRIGAATSRETSVALFNQSGGSVQVEGRIDIGDVTDSPSNTYHISGGTLEPTGNILVGHFSAGTLTVSGTGEILTNAIVIVGAGENLTGEVPRIGSGTINLNGGVVSVGRITGGPSTGEHVLNFDGGTLRGRGDEGNLIARGDEAGSGLTVNLLEGGAIIDSNDFDIGIQVGMLGSGSLTKIGENQLKLGGIHEYTGDSIVEAGLLTLLDDGAMTFAIGANGVNNQITGNENGTFVASGDFIFDLSAAAPSGSWTIVDTESLGTYTLNETFTVVGWTDQGENVWTTTSDGVDFSYDAASGILTALSDAIDYATWIDGTFENGTVPEDMKGSDDDPDLDGITNLVEFAIEGQDPTVGNPSVGTFDGSTLTYLKRQTPVVTGISYFIEESDDLGMSDLWEAVDATEDAVSISYTFPDGPLKSFLRLKVTEP